MTYQFGGFGIVRVQIHILNVNIGLRDDSLEETGGISLLFIRKRGIRLNSEIVPS